MARSEDQTASFMMLCLGDFSSKLYIPTKFMTKYRQALQQSMILESDYSGKCWDVKIKKINSDFYMKDGWPEFVKDNQLGDLDFLIFRLNGESTFNVSIYRSDGCPKHPSSAMSSGGADVDESGIKRGRGRPRKNTPNTSLDIPIPPSRSAHGSEDIDETSGIKRGSVRPRKRKRGAKARTRNCFFKEGNPHCFETCLKTYQTSRISLPQEFANLANMKAKEQVRMEYVGCNRHGLCVAVNPTPWRPTIVLANGWAQFREANGLVYGKMYSFEFNPNDQVIYVKEVAPN